MNQILIIAEAGVNHNGSIELAKQLINSASKAGADFVKFQTFITDLNISKSARKANYQIGNLTKDEESQFEMVKKLELRFEDFVELKDYCKQKDIGFLSTGFDIPSVDFLHEIGQPFFKIPSGEITNKPLLEHIARKGKPVIMSTGMANLAEISKAIEVLISEGLNYDMITLMHCNTEYPTPMKDVNLKAMNTLANTFKVKVGYSDHTQGIEIPIAAAVLGASVIEKHFTLDRNLPGPDHNASLEPQELKAMVSAIKNVLIALSGNGVKEPSPSELSNILVARKSIHIAKEIKIGEIITREHLIMMRPGDGISPMEIDSIVGKKCTQNLNKDSKLSWEWIEG